MQGGPQDPSSEPGADSGAPVPWYERRPGAAPADDPDATQAVTLPDEPDEPAGRAHDPDATQAVTLPDEPDEPAVRAHDPDATQAVVLPDEPAHDPDATEVVALPHEPARVPSPEPVPLAATGAAARRAGHRTGGARAARLLSWVAFTLGVLLVVGSGTAFGLYRHYGGRIEQLPDAPALQAGADGQAVVGRDEVYLVVGSDSADDLTDAQLDQIGANRSNRDGVRTDTIILVEVPADGSRASLVSFPRDSWVDIPRHGMDKINAAYGLGEEDAPGGGPNLLIETVEQLSGRDVDHYVQVSLFGFVTITNAVGGVEVCLAAPAQDEDANVDLPAGRQVLDGNAALGFVRQRKGIPGGDLGRIKRQQHFIGALSRKVLTAGTLLNPGRLNDLLNAATDSIKVAGTTQEDLLRLGLQLREVSAGSIRFQTVPVADADARVGDASVVLLDEAALPGFFRTLGEASGPRAVLIVPPSSIAVDVQDATPDGTGRAAADALAEEGFIIRSVQPADGGTTGGATAGGTTAGGTLVRHGIDRLQSAQTLQASLPGSELLADPELAADELVLTVGSDYAGVRRVTISSADEDTAVAAEARTAADEDCIP